MAAVLAVVVMVAAALAGAAMVVAAMEAEVPVAEAMAVVVMVAVAMAGEAWVVVAWVAEWGSRTRQWTGRAGLMPSTGSRTRQSWG